MDIDYLRLALVAIIGVVLYYAMMTQYNAGAANVIVLTYGLLSIRVYQALGSVKRVVAKPSV
ncbi:MAG: hypothetical protein ACQETI_02165 [Halobacteriota archaeon]